MGQDDCVEQDSLGQVQVPIQAYYGAQTQRAVMNFAISGIEPYPAFISVSRV
jgi:fumarate hydratase class II